MTAPIHRARDNVINATGVWADRIRPEELHYEAEVPRSRPSRGTHITLATYLPLGPARSCRRARDADLRAAVARRHADRHHRQRLRGRRSTASTPGARGHRVPAGGHQRLLRHVAGAGDLTGAFAGVRPLISTGDPKKSVDISRKAELYETSSGLITITGGKLTTWRRMAKTAIDRLVERDGRHGAVPTHEIPLGQPVGRAPPRVEGVGDGRTRRSRPLRLRRRGARDRRRARRARAADHRGTPGSACGGALAAGGGSGSHGR